MTQFRWMEKKVNDLWREIPDAGAFFKAMALPEPFRNDEDGEKTLTEYFQTLNEDVLEDSGMDREELIQRFDLYLDHISEVEKETGFHVESVTVQRGQDKNGEREKLDLTMKKGEIICVVGPTGAGKSRLLADIEWMAQGDTPTGRKVLVNEKTPPREWRFSLEHKLVAQLSQNMNFVVDMTVYDFIKMHAESRRIEDVENKTINIVRQANRLAGESFAADTPVTALSGGQSRALMIADAAFLSTSPIVLIDEIENAGIDRKQALGLLVRKEKIVMMATHDPILALMGDKRVVIKNGGIKDILFTSPAEKANLAELEHWDRVMSALRNKVRAGERIEEIESL